ncbi:MAG: hypothetical protein QXR62_04990, partial [Candidatus Bathyarchaeia archaeon]
TALIMPFLCHFQSVLTEIPNFLATSEGRKSSSSIKELMELNKYLNLSTPKTADYGVTALESFGLEVDPVKGTLKEAELLPLAIPFLC